MIELKEGHCYWILTAFNHGLVIDKSHFEDLKYLEFSHTTHKLDDGKKWYFRIGGMELDHSRYTIVKDYLVVDEWSMNQRLFKSQDEFLKYLTVYLDNLNSDESDKVLYYFDDWVKQRIKKSQKENPEIWI